MRVLPLAVVLGALACTSAGVLRLDPMPRPRTNPDSIQLLGQEPQRPYIVIAIVSARTEVARGVIGTGDRVGPARKRLLKEAARLGGDAVLVDISSVNHAGGAITGKVIAFTQSTGVN
jgi:hypothetical protein